MSLSALFLFCALRSLRIGIHTDCYLGTICVLLLQLIFVLSRLRCRSDFIAVLPLRYAVLVSYNRLQDFKQFTATKILLESNARCFENRPCLHCQGIIDMTCYGSCVQCSGSTG